MYNYKFFKTSIVFSRMKNKHIKDVNIPTQKADQLGIVSFAMFDPPQLEHGVGLGRFLVGDLHAVHGLTRDPAVNGTNLGQIILQALGQVLHQVTQGLLQ